jgi:hypothetical protein
MTPCGRTVTPKHGCLSDEEVKAIEEEIDRRPPPAPKLPGFWDQILNTRPDRLTPEIITKGRGYGPPGSQWP